MKRFALYILGCLVLTGCSELQVIGRATVRELSADTISVEKDRYRVRPARQPKVVEKRTQLAKVDQVSLPEARKSDSTSKELWRH
jgi:outer membrane murein-binding lipoprotein Lpp